MSQFSSTMIDDEDLIEQLRTYGETNLPLPASQAPKTFRSKKARASYLNEDNRDIYLKKLNHYKAREKIGTNPSRQYMKAHEPDRKSIDIKRISNIYKINDDFDEDDDIEELDSKDGIIELDKTEYIEVVNGCTSPMSMSDYEPINYDPISSNRYSNDDFGQSLLSSTRAPSIGGQMRSPGQVKVKSPEEQNAAYGKGYPKSKDRIELDDTLSKYRMDIENILQNSVSRSRMPGTAASKYLNDDVLNNYKKSSTESGSQRIMYCPKPEPIAPEERTSFFNSFKSTFFTKKNKEIKPIMLSETGEGLRKREPIHKNEKPNLPPLATRVTPKSTTSVFSKIGSLIANAGHQFSKFLPYLVIIIFTLAALQYMNVKFHNKENSLDAQITDIFDQTHKTSEINTKESSQSQIYCSDIKDTKCSGTKLLLKTLIDYLRKRSGLIDCTSLTTHKPVDNVEEKTKLASLHFKEKCVHVNEVIDYLINKQELVKNPEVNKELAIDSVLKAIVKNSHWEILLLNESYLEVSDSENVTYLISLISSKSFFCRVKELIYFIYVRAVIFGMAVITLFLGYLVFLAYKKNKAAVDKEYFSLISQVTAMVEKQYELSLLDPVNIKPYIAISHIYDTLVDPSERATKKKLWNKIVNFIQDHESRIHLETQFINGEETHVWKWIVAKHESVLKNKYKDTGIGLANSTMINPEALKSQSQNSIQNIPTSNKPLEKQYVEPIQTNGWQGSAFNRSEKLSHYPTPCLKIRNMFDFQMLDMDSNLPQKIHNDILRKCLISNENKTILHISCDKKSKEGCVYVKCASNKAAGEVYEALDGSWYNGR